MSLLLVPSLTRSTALRRTVSILPLRLSLSTVKEGQIPVDVDHYTAGWNISDVQEFTKRGKYTVRTFNKISPIGLAQFPQTWYNIEPAVDGAAPGASAILLRSHKLEEQQVDVTVRAIARCGAGTNNIPVARMTELGIPVFNTPGANANAVKELIICAMLLASRRIVDGVNHMKQLGQQGLARERVEKDKAMFGGRELRGKTLAVIGLGHIGAATARDAVALGMMVHGYDPGLSVKSALQLPRDITLTDSIASAITNADYVSLNIPYIKKSPSDGGTHGIIGADVIGHFKQDAVLLNFARGELVDSLAMKRFLDSGDGRYVSDFPDDELWNHKNAIIMPHLGASTEEAEDAAAAMAAETIREYLEHGNIRNSVNFPSTSLAERHDRVVRITVVNKNNPGVLAKITECFADAGVNIAQQINQSRGDIAYNVIDLDPANHEDGRVFCLKDMQHKMTMIDGVLSTRILFGNPGKGYARQINGEYFA
jgi:D-3-phosphoglycerate dehydrogenase / 2-oxoglutarate reductase